MPALPMTPIYSALPPGIAPGPVEASVAAVPMNVPVAANRNIPITEGALPPQEVNTKPQSDGMTDLKLAGMDGAVQMGTHLAASNAGVAAKLGGEQIAKAVGGTVAAGASAAISTVGAVIHRNRDLQSLLDEYRGMAAMRFGVTPERVGVDEIRRLSELKGQEVLKQELEKIDSNVVQTPMRSIVSTVAGLGAGAVTGVMGLPAAGFGGVVTGMAGFAAGSAAANKAMDWVIGSTEYATANAKIDEMKTKHDAGQEVTARDLFELQLLVDPHLAKQVVNHTGYEYASLDDAGKAKSMQHRDFAGTKGLAEYSAFLINSGTLNVADLRSGEVRHMLAESYVASQQTPPSTTVYAPGAVLTPMQVAQATQQVPANTQGGFANALLRERQAAMGPGQTQV